MSLNVEVLQQSFDRIKPQAAEFANSFYQHLFADYPQVQPMFAHTNMVEQKKHLIASLALVIDNLRKPEALKAALAGLGARHVKYGTMEKHYPMVGGTLLKTFESFLGEEWTPEVRQAWTDAYEAIANIMLEGASAVS